MDPIKQLEELCTALGLEYSDQDWGIVNAVPRRVREFMDFYESRSLTGPQRCHMLELILASANDAMVEGLISEADLGTVIQFAVLHQADAQVIFDYWRRLDGDEFPIGRLFRGDSLG